MTLTFFLCPLTWNRLVVVGRKMWKIKSTPVWKQSKSFGAIIVHQYFGPNPKVFRRAFPNISWIITQRSAQKVPTKLTFVEMFQTLKSSNVLVNCAICLGDCREIHSFCMSIPQTIQHCGTHLWLEKPILRKEKNYTWHLTHDTWHMTPDIRHLPGDMWHGTHGGGVNIFSKCKLCSFLRFRVHNVWKTFPQRITYWINYWIN